MPSPGDLTEGSSPPPVDLGHVLGVLRRRWPIVVGTALALLALSIATSAARGGTYRAQAELLVLPSAGGGGDAAPALDATAEVEFVKSRTVKEAARRTMGASVTVSAAAVGTSGLLTVSAPGSSGRDAVRRVNGYVEAYLEVRRDQALARIEDVRAEIERKLGQLDRQQSGAAGDAQLSSDELARLRLAAELLGKAVAGEGVGALDRASQILDQLTAGSPPGPLDSASLVVRRSFFEQQLDSLDVAASLARRGQIRLVSPATKADEPIGATGRRGLVVALIIGLLLGATLAFLAEMLDDSVRTRRALSRIARGVPVLGVVPAGGSALSALDEPEGRSAEGYRTLRSAVLGLPATRDARTVAIVGVGHDGPAMLATANVAVALAQAGHRVVAASAALGAAGFGALLGTDEGPGLAEALSSRADPASVGFDVPAVPGLVVVPSGDGALGASLAASGTAGVLSALAARGRVVVHAPAVLASADGLLLAAQADATVVVVAAGRDTVAAVEQALDSLASVEARVAGLVLSEERAVSPTASGRAREQVG